MSADHYRYPFAGLGPLLFIPWLGVVTALALAYILLSGRVPLVPSTVPAGYFALFLSIAISVYFFRYDRYRRQEFDTAEDGLTVISARGKRETTGWSDLVKAEYHTNTGALILRRSRDRRALVLYPVSLERGAALVATIDVHTALGLAAIPDLQAALQRAG